LNVNELAARAWCIDTNGSSHSTNFTTTNDGGIGTEAAAASNVIFSINETIGLHYSTEIRYATINERRATFVNLPNNLLDKNRPEFVALNKTDARDAIDPFFGNVGVV
jgi:hypothetical protein